MKRAIYIFFAACFFVFPSHGFANNRGLTGVTYTTRADWGADETMRYTTNPAYKAFAIQQDKAEEESESSEPTQQETAMNYLHKTFRAHVHIDRIFTKEAGKLLRRPLQYVKKKTKLIVHHTATQGVLPQTIAEEKTYMKNLYTYHSEKNGWGDIGYNFVIMPSGRIYEGRKGGAGIVGAHVAFNNTPSVGVSLVGNFEEIIPTQEQVTELTNILTALAKKYTIDPSATTTYFKKSSSFPYVTAVKNVSIIGHTDAGYTQCPGKSLYALLPAIRDEVKNRLAGQGPSTIVVPSTISSVTSVTLTQSSSHQPAAVQSSVSSPKKPSIKRLDVAPSVDRLQTIQKLLVRVLLYEASQNKKWDLTCEKVCIVRINGLMKTTPSLTVTKTAKAFVVSFQHKTYEATKFAVSAGDTGVVHITTYERKASNGQSLSLFRQSLLFVYGPRKTYNTKTNAMNTTQETGHHIINILSLPHYLMGIAEASDQEDQTKANVLALLTKAYALYYMGGTFRHPSIPEGALYNAIDDPRMFQKYVGKGRESLSKKWPIALEQTKNSYITYKNLLPILPYFHCSTGKTIAAAEKWGRSDTPYLSAVKDVVSCDTMAGHGVGLSGKGAAKMAEEGKTVSSIIQYYYPGVEIKTISEPAM